MNCDLYLILLLLFLTIMFTFFTNLLIKKIVTLFDLL